MCRVDFIEEENYFSILNKMRINVIVVECHTSDDAITDNPLEGIEWEKGFEFAMLKDGKRQAK